MNYFIFLIIPLLWGTGDCNETKGESIISSSLSGVKTAAAAAAEGIGAVLGKIPFVQKTIFPNCTEPPMECPNENITFWYYTRDTASTPLKMNISDLTSLNNYRKGKSPWHVIIHGYTKSKDEIPNPELRTAYFKHGDYDVISVDYEPLARCPCYLQAVHNVPLIAKCTAQMLDFLIDGGIFQSNSVHVLGFSLGAHIAGLLYKYMRNKKLNRLTGLDPASPLFDGKFHDTISSQSADYVEVMHTNALMKGKLEPLGHTDFYFNGGFVQPGCVAIDNKTFSTCSHDRSPIYFAESINSRDAFWGIRCDNVASFYSGACDTTPENLVWVGEQVNWSLRGTYFLNTNSQPPYGLGKVAKVGKS